MKQLVEGIAKALVDYPQDVVVNLNTEGNKISLNLKVNSEDRGLIIGRNGRTIKSIQTICNAAAKESNQFVKIDIA